MQSKVRKWKCQSFCNLRTNGQKWTNFTTLCEFQDTSGQSTKFREFQDSAQAWVSELAVIGLHMSAHMDHEMTGPVKLMPTQVTFVRFDTAVGPHVFHQTAR